MNKKDVPIEKLNLSKKSYDSLKTQGINKIEELLHLSIIAMIEIKDLELYSVVEIMYSVGKYITEELRTENEFNQNTLEGDSDTLELDVTGISIGKFREKKVLHVIDEGSIEKELADVLFFDNSTLLVDDVEVMNMNLSSRSEGILIRNGLCTAKKIIFANYKDYEELKGFGKNSREEVLHKLKEMIYIQYKSDKNRELIETTISTIEADIKEHCTALKLFQYIGPIKVAVYRNESLIKNNPGKAIENKELMNRIYSELSVYRVFVDYIVSLLQTNKMIHLNELMQQLPEGMCNSNVLLQMIDQLSAEGKIDCTDNGLCLHLLTLEEYLKLLEEDNSKKMLIYRIHGMTLEEAGSEIGVTRERARQLTKKALEKLPELKEDGLKYWFENYSLTAEEFQTIFEVSKEIYHYLLIRYNRGGKQLEELLNDKNITGKIARKVLLEMRKYCVIINGEYIPIRRELILRKLVEVNFSDKECTFSEFLEFYMEFLMQNGLDKDEKLLFPTERAFEARLKDNNYTLLKYGHRFRYYDMEAYDIQTLFNEFNFEVYEDLEISTLKLFRTHKELMVEYGIWDEYELHNLMKKNEELLEPYGVSMGRMPFISVGNANRSRQTIQFLYRVAPIGLYEFGSAYEEEFGVKSETALANFSRYVDKYYHNGSYSIDYEIMSAEEYHMIESRLEDEVYFIEDVKNLYLEIFPRGCAEKINPYTLKTMGFKVFADYILKNTYPSGEAYFKTFLLKNETIDMDILDKRLTQNQTFQIVLEELRVHFNLLEIEKNKYISFLLFSRKAPSVTKEDLEKFVTEASSYSKEDFFTIQSIKKEGFSSSIDCMGFSDWFYGALLRSCKDICYSKVAGGFLFSRLGRQFKRSDFFLFIMKKLLKIHIIEFIAYISNTYGLCFDRYDITPIINQSVMFYDSATEKIYLNKEVYYEDI